MKKTLNIKFVFIIFLAIMLEKNCLFSQICPCEVDPNCNISEAGGFCPNPVPDAVQNEYFSQSITVVAPSTGEWGGISIPVNYIDITAIEGLPNGLRWCKTTDHFTYDNPRCLNIWGIPVDTGLFPLVIKVRATVLGSLKIDREDNTLSIYVKLSQAPEVNFNAKKNEVQTNELVEFWDYDTTATNRNWYFEKGTIVGNTDSSGRQQFPIVKWTEPGYYTVSLYAQNSNSTKNRIKHNYIKVVDEYGYCPEQAMFYSAKREIVVKEKMRFFYGCPENGTWMFYDESVSSNMIINESYCHDYIFGSANLLWTFEKGNPSTSSELSPAVFWDSPGTYKVTLLVNGNDELAINNYVKVKNVSEKLYVFPNPASNKIVVEALDMKKIELFDMAGKLILSVDDGPTHVVIDLPVLPLQTYLLKVTYINGKAEFKKVILG